MLLAVLMVSSSLLTGCTGRCADLVNSTVLQLCNPSDQPQTTLSPAHYVPNVFMNSNSTLYKVMQVHSPGFACQGTAAARCCSTYPSSSCRMGT